jgi:hypothetical protein
MIDPCPECGRDRTLVGKQHRCIPLSSHPIVGEQQRIARKAADTKIRKKLPPMEHPEGEPIVGAALSGPEVPARPIEQGPHPAIASVSKKRTWQGANLDAVERSPLDTPSARRGRPAKYTSEEERKAKRAAAARKRRAK